VALKSDLIKFKTPIIREDINANRLARPSTPSIRLNELIIVRKQKKVREIETTITNSIIKTLDRIHNLGVQLTLEASQLKPFAMEFMSAFSFNPLKFFGAGAGVFSRRRWWNSVCDGA
jgi:hypothetical protein